MKKKQVKQVKQVKVSSSQDLTVTPVSEPVISVVTETAPSADFSRDNFPIVGLGASGGGLEALKAFFSEVPEDSGIAYVVVVHLSPTHPSILAELIQNSACIPISSAEDRQIVQPNHAYVIPPDRDISIYNGRLHLMDIPDATPHLPINSFLSSLAQERQNKAAAVILSGTGADGTLGLEEIKSIGGLVLVQSEASAEYDGMPGSAIGTGLADIVVPPNEMPQLIVHWFKNKTGAHVSGQGIDTDITEEPDSWLNKIFDLLRSRLGYDFSAYKVKTISRRIKRRMRLNQIEGCELYLRFLREQPSEINALFRELLIGVTSFFRDAESFEALKNLGLPDVCKEMSDNSTFRVWVPGCSTGEEVFSLAIVLREYLGTIPKQIELQLFGTDIDSYAIEKARQGLFPSSITADVSEERLSRYFVPEGNQFRISKEIRDCVIFSAQDVLSDPPFSRLNLVCCRNLLIYLEGAAQKRLLPLFHYTLNPCGILMLGSSETIGGFTNLFGTLDKKWKIYKRLELPSALRSRVEFPNGHLKVEPTPHKSVSTSVSRKNDLGWITRQAILDQFILAAVLVDSSGDLLHVHGQAGKYLEQPCGPPTQNIIALAREGLPLELSKALRDAKSTLNPVVRRRITVKVNGITQMIDLHVRFLHEPNELAGQFLVIFEESEELPPCPASLIAICEQPAPGRIIELEKELQLNREIHQNSVEDLEFANEGLKSANEELQSSNEELQAANEELESSKEELQSMNEELQTVNAELHSKMAELSAAHDDMRNLLDSTEIATIFVDNDLRVRRFTPGASVIVNLIPGDTGRPLEHVMTNLSYDGIIADLQDVLRKLTPRELEVQTKEGVWYGMRIMPYRTTDNRIDGAVLTFSNIGEQKKTQESLQALLSATDTSRELVRSVFDMNSKPMLVLDGKGATVIINTGFADLVGLSEEDIIGKNILGEVFFLPEQADLVSRLKTAIDEGTSFTSPSVELELPGGSRKYTITWRAIHKEDDSPYRILVSFMEDC